MNLFPPTPQEDRANGRNNNCYNPLLNVTHELKKQFMGEIQPICVEMEKLYGIPACFLGAQAAQESGCGTTRIAYYANNISALKYVSAWGRKGGILDGSDLDVKTYQLEGQPDEAWDGSVEVIEDLGQDRKIFKEDTRYDNRYFAFETKRDFFDFLCRVAFLGSSFGKLYPTYLKLYEAFRLYHEDMRNGYYKAAACERLAWQLGSRGYCHMEKPGYTAEERRGAYYSEVIRNQMNEWGTQYW